MRVPMIGGPADGLEYEIPEPLPQTVKVQAPPGPRDRWALERRMWPTYVYLLRWKIEDGQERPAYVC